MSPSQLVVDRPWLQVGCTLGEGPLYDPSTSWLHFVDISERKVFHVDTSTSEITIDDFQEPVSCLAIRKNGSGLACAAAQGFAVLGNDASIQYLSKPLPAEDAPYTRFNDGGCDSQGRFFAGTIYSPERNIPGKLFKYDPASGRCVVVDEGPFTDSNGLGWSPDEKTFYFTDSLVNKIYAYDYVDGELSNRRIFIDAVEKGYPENTFCDGLCVDEDGGVWSARWGGSKIVRFTKDGEVDMEIVFPTALNITACCFGGSNNDQLFVTTAHCKAIGGDASRQAQYPDSGHVFLVDLAGRFTGLNRCQFAG